MHKTIANYDIMKLSMAVTEKAKRIIFDIPKVRLSEILGIGRATLDKRLKDDAWSYSEFLIICSLEKQTA